MSMRFFVLSIVLAVFMLASCEKPNLVPPEDVVVDINITGVNTPASGNRNQPIIASISMTAPNQCYRFSHFQVATQNPLLFEVRAKATIPNPDAGTVVCVPQTYTKDTTLSFNTHLTGKHVIRYYNGTQIFKVDTVIIN